MRSVVVVLPASMWAMIPMFRTRSSAIACCVTATGSFPPLPAIVREGLVGLRHPVDVVLLLESAALLVDRVEDLAADAARADLQDRRDGLHCLLERLDGRLAGLLANLGQRAVDDLLGERLL